MTGEFIHLPQISLAYKLTQPLTKTVRLFDFVFFRFVFLAVQSTLVIAETLGTVIWFPSNTFP